MPPISAGSMGIAGKLGMTGEKGVDLVRPFLGFERAGAKHHPPAGLQEARGPFEDAGLYARQRGDVVFALQSRGCRDGAGSCPLPCRAHR